MMNTKLLIENSINYQEVITVDFEVDEIKTKWRKSDYVSSSIVKLECDQKIVSVRFNFMDKEELFDSQLLFVSETSLLFFNCNYQKGIINIDSGRLIELINAHDLGFPERVKDCVIFDDELSVRSYTLHGKFIHEIPIDPPTNRKIMNEHIEYKSPIFGTQLLSLKK